MISRFCCRSSDGGATSESRDTLAPPGDSVKSSSGVTLLRHVLLASNDSDLDTEADLPPLEAVIPRDMLRKLKPKEKKRQDVINGETTDIQYIQVYTYIYV